MNNVKIVGVDIGGTKIEAGLVTGGSIQKSVKNCITANGTKELVIKEVISTIEAVTEPGVTGIGIGVPGLVDTENGVIFQLQNIPSWKEVCLKQELENYFKIPVYINNDANCFAIGEKHFGNGKHFANFVGLTLGTGLGAGIIFNNKLYSGVYSGAGEFGSIPYLSGIYEDYCSGKFFKNEYSASGDELFKNALKNDSRALFVYRQFGYHLGNVIKTILFSVAPEAVILGGSVSKAFSFFKDSMWENVHTFPFKKIVNNLKIEVAGTNNIAVLGAAALCKSD